MDALKIALDEVGVRDLVAVSKPVWRPLLDSGTNGVEGLMVIAGQPLRFGFWLPDEFPGALPQVFALSPELLRLPHIDERGLVCAFEDENTLLDYRAADGLVRETVARARSVVEAGLLGRNRADFLAEFEAYWPRSLGVFCAVLPSDEARQIKASFDGPKFVAIADNTDALNSTFRNGAWQLKNGAYLPLKPFELGKLHPRDLCSWDALLPLLSDSSVEFAQKMRVAKKQSLPLVVGIQRTDGERTLVGMTLRKFAADACLLDARPSEIRPFTVTRFDDVQVRQRLGAGSGSRVVVIGCGSIGGHVAHVLAWSGARELVLIDPDLGGPSNTFRHVLGRRAWCVEKVLALKPELERCLPGLTVTAIPKTARAALAEQPELLRTADAVVIAIGNHSVPLQLNDLLAAGKVAVPVVFAWLEPYGIGGHAVLVDYHGNGCLRCLFDEHPGLRCKVEFAEPGQRFGQRDAGCHSLFTPYGDMDARTTAMLAARLVQQATGDAQQRLGRRHSWRGDGAAFLAAGFDLSQNYADYVSDAAIPLARRAECPTCKQ